MPRPPTRSARPRQRARPRARAAALRWASPPTLPPPPPRKEVRRLLGCLRPVSVPFLERSCTGPAQHGVIFLPLWSQQGEAGQMRFIFSSSLPPGTIAEEASSSDSHFHEYPKTLKVHKEFSLLVQFHSNLLGISSQFIRCPFHLNQPLSFLVQISQTFYPLIPSALKVEKTATDRHHRLCWSQYFSNLECTS